jgi:ribosomal protein S18 acetylase RimI-like enzyme
VKRQGFSLHNEWQDVRIHQGLASDAPALADFAARVFREAFGADSRPDDLHAHLAATFGTPQQTAELTDPAVVTLLAENRQTLVAYAQVRRHPPPPCVTQARPVELHRFYVDRPAHGKGVARLLMAEVGQAARRLQGRHLWLSTWERNARAIAFYKKIGFKEVGRADFVVGSDRQQDLVMVAEVAATLQAR